MTEEAIVSEDTQGEAAPEISDQEAHDDAVDTAQQQAEQESAKGEDERKDQPSRAEKRINQLTWEARQAQRELAELKAWKAEQEKTSAPKQEKPNRPREEDFHSTEDYEAAVDDYHDKLTDWKLEQRFSEREKKQEEDNKKLSESQKQEKNARLWQEREDKFAAKTPDYTDVIADFASVLQRNEDANSALITREILHHEKGPELLYHLAKNRDVAVEIYRTPHGFAVESINKLAGSLGTKPPNHQKELPNPPSGGRSAASGAKSDDNLSGKELRKKHGLL